MHPLPEFLCEWIDSLASGKEFEDSEQAWVDWRDEFERYLDEGSDFTLSDRDAATQGELPYLLQNLEAALSLAIEDASKLDLVLERAVQFFRVHDEFLKERSRAYFVQDSILEEFLKVCMSVLHARAGFEAVERRIPKARASLNLLRSLELDGPTERLQDGLRALERIEQAGFERDILESHSVKLKAAVADWEQVALAGAGDLPAIPVIGEALAALEQDPEVWPVVWEESWPAFLDYWEMRPDGWMLRPERLQAVWSQGEETVDKFGEALFSYRESPEAFWASVAELEDWFANLPEHQLKLDGLSLSAYESEALLVFNLLQGRAPLYASQSFVRSIKSTSERVPHQIRSISAALETYLEDRRPQHLLSALQDILDAVERAKGTIACLQCGERLELNEISCLSCGHRIKFEPVSG